MPNVLNFAEIEAFFEVKWTPTITHLHSPGGGLLSDFLQELCYAFQDLKVQEVRSIMVSTCMFALL